MRVRPVTSFSALEATRAAFCASLHRDVSNREKATVIGNKAEARRGTLAGAENQQAGGGGGSGIPRNSAAALYPSTQT
jgi:hypothetical protein